MSAIAAKRCMQKQGEEGYILVAVIFMLAILILSLAVAIPRVKEDIQRDREIETMHRGKQYARAIKLYYKKFNAYPPNIDALVMTNQIRFLRKRYKDPMTGKDDWKPIMFGQNKTPLAMGFFGQPLGGLGGSPLAGTGPSGGNGIAGASPIGSDNSSSGSSFSNGSPTSGSSTFSSGGSFSSGSSTFGQSGSSTFGSSSSSPTGGTGTTNPSGSTGSSGSSGMFGDSMSSNQTYGGGGIIGFSPGSDKKSILTYKKKDHYNQWEFTYSPLADQMISGGNAGTIGQPVGGTGTTGSSTFGGSTFGGTSSTFGGTSSSGFGGTSPTSPTSPTTPQSNSPQQ